MTKVDVAVEGITTSPPAKPLIFISHKHSDRVIANVLRGFMSEQSAGHIRVYQSSDAEAEGPRPGHQLNTELRAALWEAQVVVLVYTTPDKDWGYCMWECGVATNPASPDTRIIVFQCHERVPDIFAGEVHVNARQPVDVTKFVVNFMTSPDFLPRSTGPITGFAPSSVEVRRAADKLLHDLRAVLPEGSVSESFVHPFLQLQISTADLAGITDVDTGDTRLVSRTLVIDHAVVTDGDRDAASIFGMAELRTPLPFERVFREWRRTRVDDSDAWIDSLADQVARVAQSQLPSLKWTPMQSALTDTCHAPVVVRVRRVPAVTAMQFDVQFFPWRVAARSRTSDVDRVLFQDIFGPSVTRDGLTAVFPTAMTAAEIGDDTVPRSRGLHYPNPPSEARDAEAKGIEYVVPLEDLQASAQLAEMCERVDVPFRTELDFLYSNRHELLPKKSLIALGLGFNHVTSRLSRMTSLFRIEYPEGTDDFLLGSEPHGFPKEGMDCGLVARVVIQHNDNFVPHFVCAGRTAAGTMAGGFFLGRRWKDLIAVYAAHNANLKTDSLALLIAFRHGVMDTADIYGEPVFDRRR